MKHHPKLSDDNLWGLDPLDLRWEVRINGHTESMHRTKKDAREHVKYYKNEFEDVTVVIRDRLRNQNTK